MQIKLNGGDQCKILATDALQKTRNYLLESLIPLISPHVCESSGIHQPCHTQSISSEESKLEAIFQVMSCEKLRPVVKDSQKYQPQSHR